VLTLEICNNPLCRELDLDVPGCDDDAAMLAGSRYSCRCPVCPNALLPFCPIDRTLGQFRDSSPVPAVSPSTLPLPKYHQIYLVLREQLAEGRHAQGLPGELGLAAEFGVARVTIRKAMERLVAEGLVERSPGRGTVPKARVPLPARGRRGSDDVRSARLSGLLENIVNMGLATQVQVLSCERVLATPSVAEALSLEVGAAVQKAVRIRSLAAGPLALITTHLPWSLAAGIDAIALKRKPLLLLLESNGVRIGEATQTVTARLADAEAARHLQVDVGSALLSVTRLVRDARGRPVQWLHGLYRPDRYEYRMELSRVGKVDAKVWVSKDLSPDTR
jgi:GntR family transcriptional regulator